MIRWLERHDKISWTICLVIAITIFYVSSLAFEPGGKGALSYRPIAYHILIFFLLEFFLLISILKGKNGNLKLALIGIVVAVLYGILDEIHQYFVPGRAVSVDDLALDSLGIMLAFIIYMINLEYNLLRSRKSLL